MSDPSLLTKAKLKEELKLHNIPLPSSQSLKQVYVDLYREHILQENGQSDAEEDEAKSEIETDEESLESQEEDESVESDSEIVFKTSSQVVQEKKRSPKKRYRQTKLDFSRKEENTDKPQASEKMSVKELSDVDLAQELKDMGESPGPITATTRSVYERKLIKLRQARGDSTAPTEVLETSNYEEVPDDEENQPPPKPKSSPARKPRMTEEGTRLTRRNIASVRNEPPPEEMDRTAPSVPIPDTPQKTGISIWIKLLLFIIAVFFVYLVYINMEPSSNSQVPKSINSA